MPRYPREASLTPQQFRAWRDKLALTQTEVASLLGMSPRHISHLENGWSPITKTIKLSCILIAEIAGDKPMTYLEIYKELNIWVNESFPEEGV